MFQHFYAILDTCMSLPSLSAFFGMVCEVFLFQFGQIIGPQCQHIRVSTWRFSAICSAGVSCSSFFLIIHLLSSSVPSPLLGRSPLRLDLGRWFLGFTLLDTWLEIEQDPRSWLCLSRVLLSYCPPLLAVFLFVWCWDIIYKVYKPAALAPQLINGRLPAAHLLIRDGADEAGLPDPGREVQNPFQNWGDDWNRSGGAGDDPQWTESQWGQSGRQTDIPTRL